MASDDFFAALSSTNNPPVEIANFPLDVREGQTAFFRTSDLSYIDETPDDRLVYTITQDVEHGQLYVDANRDYILDASEKIGLGETFTQFDIGARLFNYVHDGSETRSDGFSYTLSDGSNVLPEDAFSIKVQPVNDAPTISLPHRPDIVVVNSDSNNFDSILNDGTGGFDDYRVAFADEEPVSVALGDFDRDGHLDAVFANALSNTISVSFGDGAGNFRDGVSFAVGERPMAVALGDLNGDRRLDIVVANEGSDDVNVLLGNGSGGFIGNRVISTASVGDGPRAIALGDFNSDGRLDAITTNSGSRDTSVLLGDGTGGFVEGRALTSPSTGTYPISIALADLDGDNDLDAVVANRDIGNLSILYGNGTGGFSNDVNLQKGYGEPTSVALGDIDGDGDVDAVVVNSYFSTISVFKGNDDGSLFEAGEFSAGPSAYSVALGDLDGDGDLDAVVTNVRDDKTYVLANDGSGKFTTDQILTTGFTPTAVAIGRVAPDVAAIESTAYTFSTEGGNTISIGDADAGESAVTVTFSVDHGSLTLARTAGLSFQNSTANGDQTVVVLGTVEDINNALDGLIYRSDLRYQGVDSLKVTVSDNGNSGDGGARTVSDALSIAVDASVRHISGDAGDNDLVGSADADRVLSFEGIDTVSAGAGADVVLGNEGDDLLYGNAQSDTIFGGQGDDRIYGGDGPVDPEDDGDYLLGNKGNDTVFGNGGADVVYGNEGQDNVFGGEGDDTLYGGGGRADALDDADRLFGNRGNDTISGNGGDDLIVAGNGVDTVFGGNGNDMIYGGEAVSSPNDDGDRVLGGKGGDIIYGNGGDDDLLGNEGSDWIFGGKGDDYIHGGQADDVIDAGDGDDTLNGGLGGDTLAGGKGADLFVFDPGQCDDIIVDYGSDDRLDLRGQSYEAHDIEGSVLLTLSGDGSILLQDVTFDEFLDNLAV